MSEVLRSEDYDARYFDGKHQDYRHNAGYGEYKRWFRTDGADSLGEFWLDKAKSLVDTYDLVDKKVLEIGSAKGFIVEDLRSFGVDAYGLDISQYVYDEASAELKPFLTVGDARTYLSKYKDEEFDVILSLRFLECLSEAELPSLVNEMNRISKSQIHFIDEKSNPNFYVEQPLSWWSKLSFTRDSTILIARKSRQEIKI